MNVYDTAVLTYLLKNPGCLIGVVGWGASRLVYGEDAQISSYEPRMFLDSISRLRGSGSVREENRKLYLTTLGRQEAVNQLKMLNKFIINSGYPYICFQKAQE